MTYCEDCGISLDRHGGECGTEAGDRYSDPDYGRPLGWATPDGTLVLPADVANLDD
ncbi:hypothetical protein [Saccharopolyspora shandongensis]|uniref:hypothetical protein n=1 Tax=Saccharopolyspora shandongensis TaxID=418495 RepID=UPI0033D487DC